MSKWSKDICFACVHACTEKGAEGAHLSANEYVRNCLLTSESDKGTSYVAASYLLVDLVDADGHGEERNEEMAGIGKVLVPRF